MLSLYLLVFKELRIINFGALIPLVVPGATGLGTPPLAEFRHFFDYASILGLDGDTPIGLRPVVQLSRRSVFVLPLRLFV